MKMVDLIGKLFRRLLVPSKAIDDLVREDQFNVITLCPVCLLPTLDLVREFTSGWLTQPKKFCRNCGYVGALTLEMNRAEYESRDPDARQSTEKTLDSPEDID